MVTSLKWTSVLSSEVEAQNFRLEASVFKVDAKKAKEELANCKYPIVPLTGPSGIATAYHRLRFRRVFVEKSDFPIFQPSQITEIKPKPELFISANTKTNIDALRVKSGQILMTCSGTIGKCTVTSRTLDNQIFSHDLLRITAKNEIDVGYIYAYCKTSIGQMLLTTNNYGAVISHIEPEHLNHFHLPYPDENIRRSIDEKIRKSYELRDKSNDLLTEAEKLLITALNLPPIDQIKPRYVGDGNCVKAFSVPLNLLHDRMDASYHVPIVDSIMDYLLENSASIVPLGNNQLTKEIILPGRFKRHYVEEGYGTVFLGGKQIYELDPYNKKYLSVKKHGSRIESQLFLHENMIAITCSGTIGKVNIIPKHWENWTMSQHVLRAVPKDASVAGYIYVWLNSDYGYELIQKYTYGSVVDEIDDRHLSQVPVPILKDKAVMDKINSLALDANSLRSEAYELEQKALRELNDKVIYG